MVRTIKPSGDVVQDAGYGLTRADYLRLVATVPTIAKAIPIRIIPAIEFRNRTRMIEGRLVGTMPDYAEVTRLAVDRGRFLTDADVDEEAQLLRAGGRGGRRVVSRRRGRRQRIMVDERVLQGGRRDEAAGAVGRHRRLAGGRELFERRLHPDQRRSGGARGT